MYMYVYKRSSDNRSREFNRLKPAIRNFLCTEKRFAKGVQFGNSPQRFERIDSLESGHLSYCMCTQACLNTAPCAGWQPCWNPDSDPRPRPSKSLRRTPFLLYKTHSKPLSPEPFPRTLPQNPSKKLVLSCDPFSVHTRRKRKRRSRRVSLNVFGGKPKVPPFSIKKPQDNFILQNAKWHLQNVYSGGEMSVWLYRKTADWRVPIYILEAEIVLGVL